MLVLIEKRNYLKEDNGSYYQVLDDDSIICVRSILTDKLLENLKQHGNTIIANSIYEVVGERRIIQEIKDKYNIDVKIRVIEHECDFPSVIIEKCKIWKFTIEIDNTKNGDIWCYKLYLNNKLHYKCKLYRYPNLKAFIDQCIETFEIEENTYEIDSNTLAIINDKPIIEDVTFRII